MKRSHAALLLAVSTLGLFFVLSRHRAPPGTVWGDEGTFLAMMASLAQDGDLRFGDADLARVEAAAGGRRHLILERTPAGVAYSKPIIYPLVAAPFYALAGERGPVILNALVLALALGLALAYLRRLPDGGGGRSPPRDAPPGRGPPDDSGAAALALVTFAGAAVLVPYVVWRMSDVLQASLALSGLVLSCARERGRPPAAPGPIDRLLSWRGAPFLGAALLGLYVAMRLTNLLVAAIPVAAALLGRRWRRAAALGMVLAASWAAAAGTTWLATGAANPYRAVRTTFIPETGYPAGPEAETVAVRFDVQSHSHRDALVPAVEPRQVAYAALYTLVGRHTGLLFYFPAALVFLLAAARCGDRLSLVSVLALGATFVFFLVWRTENYFGGDTFLGNRYFLAAYPALLLAPARLPRARWLAIAWALAAVAGVSALVSAAAVSELDRGSQNHTRAGIFRLLPFESTAHDVAGRRDRYWAGHFLRFVDPFPGVGKNHFELHAGRPAAEVLIGHWREPGTIRLWVETAAPEARLEVGGGVSGRFEVGAARAREPNSLGVPVDLELPRPWRRHYFWWTSEEIYWIHALRFRLTTPDDAPAVALVRYFGDPAVLEESFSYRLVGGELPAVGQAGGAASIRLRVLNTSPLIWEREGVLPVTAGWRLLDAAGAVVAASQSVPLAQRVEPYREIEIELPVVWPDVPGAYRLEVDLTLEHVAAFRERLGQPLAARDVQIEVSPEQQSDAPNF